MNKLALILMHVTMVCAGCTMDIQEEEDVETVEQALKPCNQCGPQRDPPIEAGLPAGTDCGRLGIGGWHCTAPNGAIYICDNDWNCMGTD